MKKYIPYVPRKGETVSFKLKKSYEIKKKTTDTKSKVREFSNNPICSGVVEHSSRRLIWINLKEVQGKPVKENTVCVTVENIL